MKSAYTDYDEPAVTVTWYLSDIMAIAEELEYSITKEEAHEIIRDLANFTNKSDGINIESIEREIEVKIHCRSK